MTREQKQIIEQLKHEFELLNSKKENKKGIIGIADLVDRQNKLIDRDNEIDMMQKAHDDARNLQIMNDIEKLRPEIESLGLVIKPMYKGIEICTPNASSSSNIIEIMYKYTRLDKLYNEYYEYNFYKEFQSHPKLTFSREAEYYGNPKFDTIEEFVKYDKFREKLSVLYRATKK